MVWVPEAESGDYTETKKLLKYLALNTLGWQERDQGQCLCARPLLHNGTQVISGQLEPERQKELSGEDFMCWRSNINYIFRSCIGLKRVQMPYESLGNQSHAV